MGNAKYMLKHTCSMYLINKTNSREGKVNTLIQINMKVPNKNKNHSNTSNVLCIMCSSHLNHGKHHIHFQYNFNNSHHDI